MTFMLIQLVWKPCIQLRLSLGEDKTNLAAFKTFYGEGHTVALVDFSSVGKST